VNYGKLFAANLLNQITIRKHNSNFKSKSDDEGPRQMHRKCCS